jgi:hypothetical protein
MLPHKPIPFDNSLWPKTVVTTISLLLCRLPESGIFQRSVTFRAHCVIASATAEATLSIWYVDRHLDSHSVVHTDVYACNQGCRQAPTRLKSLVQHLAGVHHTTPFDLPRAQPRRPSPRREPLPELPTHAPTYLVGGLQVKPSPSFDPSNVMVTETSEDKWRDFAGVDKPNADLKPFRRLEWPKAVDMAPVRKIAEEYEGVDDEEAEVESEDSEESL